MTLGHEVHLFCQDREAAEFEFVGRVADWDTGEPHHRFLPYAQEGLAPAKAVLVGSRRDAENLWEVMGDESLPERTRLGTPGVDIERFRPWPKSQVRARLGALAGELAPPEQG